MKIVEGNALEALTVGFSHFVDIGKAKDAVIYYETERNVRMLLPDGAHLSGEWKQVEGGYHVAWKGGPEGKWQISSEPGVLAYIDPSGKRAGTITRIMPGNAGNLA